MIYMVEMDFPHPERLREWHEWYLAHIRVLLTVPGFRAQSVTLVTTLLDAQAWRLIPVGANAQPAYVSYRREADGRYHAQSVSVLTVADEQIVALTCFLNPALYRRFTLPETLSDSAH